MKEIIYIFFLIVTPALLFSQGRMVINNNAFVVIDNSAKVVLANSGANALTTAGTGGNIVSENEFDILQWNIGNGSGTYVVPFTTASGVKIPFSINIATAGDNAGNILFSTYRGPTWDNSTYMPSDVTHMSALGSGGNNSANTIDRFWIVDPGSYTSKPSAVMNFTYADAEHSTAGNTITEGDLGAQRFNSATSQWGDFLPAGTVNIVSNSVSGVNVAPSDFYRSWTLAELSNPLPVELIYYRFECSTNGNAQLQWATASETNNAYFLIDASDDAYSWEEIHQIAGNGTTNAPNDYFIEVKANRYYRLTQVDTDGKSETHGVVFAGCSQEEDLATWQFENTFYLDNLEEGNMQVIIYDLNGKQVAFFEKEITGGSLQLELPRLSSGIYPVYVRNNGKIKSGKIVR